MPTSPPGSVPSTERHSPPGSAAVLHPDCLHPVANASDDYAGVECCLCDGRPCSAVTPVLALIHADFMAALLDGAA